MLEHQEKYGLFKDINEYKNLYLNISRDLDNLEQIDSLYDNIMNIFKDGIELPLVQTKIVDIDFGYKGVVQLTLFDLMINIILWKGIILSGDKIEPKHIFFDNEFTRKHIKNYIDKFIIDKHRSDFSNKKMNIINAITLQGFKFISVFALYLSNTINVEDDIKLMKTNPEVYDILHLVDELENIPIERYKDFADDQTAILIDFIINSGFHCLKDFFKAKEGVNRKQYREYAVAIGPKPTVTGDVFPAPINTSFIRGGLKKLRDLYVESNTGRTAQILTKTNVGDSGHFARIMGLNNSDTFIHRDKDFICNTKHLVKVFIANDTTLKKFDKRYYSFIPENGMLYLLTAKDDKHLIGKTLYFRSPITCQSHVEGKGICYKCYGDLAYTNYDINAGKLAVELLSSTLTQILLSAKHLLESMVKKIKWCDEFYTYLNLDCNIIMVNPDIELSKYYLIIDPENIDLISEQDQFEYNESVSEFEIKDSEGNIYKIFNDDGNDMYISVELNELIRKYASPENNKIIIPMSLLEDTPLFLIKIYNNEISKTLKKLQNIINKESETKKYNKDTIVQEFINTLIEGDLNLQAIHAETILSNQLRDSFDILLKVNWEDPNTQYQILTLNSAITYNPSIIVSMSYQRLSKVLYNPLSFSPNKNKPSFLDLFFMVTPQTFINSKEKEFSL